MCHKVQSSEMEVVTLAPVHEHCVVPKMGIRANMLTEGNGKQSFWPSIFQSRAPRSCPSSGLMVVRLV